MNCQEVARGIARLARLSPDIGELPLDDVLCIAHEVLPFDEYDRIVGGYSFYILDCIKEIEDARAVSG